MNAIKLVGAQRFISTNCGVKTVVLKDDVIEVTEAQAAYLTNLTNKDRSNNVHHLFVETTEDATTSSNTKLSTQQKLAAAVMEEVADVVEEKPEVKTRRPKKDGTRGTRNASKVVA